jgi:predicted Zn-dependent protease
MPSLTTVPLSADRAPAARPFWTRFRRKTRAGLSALCIGSLASATVVPPAPVEAQELKGVIRDAEIESLLRDYATPIFGAAGIRKGSVAIILIGDRSFNAFVADGRRMFINVGAIMDAKTPNELIGVIAHESGHIAGGHLARMREQLANAQMLTIVGMLLGGAAVVGAANSGGRVGNVGVGAVGAITGPGEIVRRSLLSYQRSEEQAADRAAVNFLDATGQSPKGLLDTFQRFNQDAMFKTASIDPYLISHPMPAERISNLEQLAAKSPYLKVKDPPALQARHEMARAKLFGFVATAEEVGRRYPLSDTSLPARYARAIVDYRYKRLGEALNKIEGLLHEQGSNPYFWELKGQALLEFGRANEAIPALRKAASLAPNSGLIRILLGRALVATETPGNIDQAISELSNATQREPDDPDGFRFLAQAYGRKGNIGMAELLTAQAYFAAGDYQNAVNQAARAQDKFPKGSGQWLKADDIINSRPPRP